MLRNLKLKRHFETEYAGIEQWALGLPFHRSSKCSECLILISVQILPKAHSTCSNRKLFRCQTWVRRTNPVWTIKARIKKWCEVYMKALIFSGFLFPICQIGKFTAMIILLFDLQPQFKYMNYFIYTSNHFTPHGRMNSINWSRSPWCVASVHSSVGRASHWYRGGHGIECRRSIDFFQASSL